MSPRRPTRQPVRTAARTLRVLLLGGLLASVLAGGDCHWAFSSKTSDDHDDGGGTTVIVTDDTVGEGPPEPVGEDALDPELLVLEGVDVEFASREELGAYRAAGGTAQPPLFQRAVPSESQPAFAGMSPARIWPVERIGETELAAFAAGLLAANEEVLALPVAAASLQYLDTQVLEGIASVRLGAADPAGGGLVLAVRFGPSGELVAIERLPLFREIGEWPGDRTPNPR